MPRRLPPIRPLVAFDAVMRHGSFSRAADELGITQSAVSHQVRRLEQYFGELLLQRRNPGVEPTEKGRTLAAMLGGVLDSLAALDAHRHDILGNGALKVGASSALANWWLIKRLRQLAATDQQVAVELVPVDTADEPPYPVDIRLVWAPATEAHRTTTQVPLPPEHVFPVCAPSLLVEARLRQEPRSLLSLPLIHKGSEPSGEWSWAEWLRRLGLPKRGLKGGEIRLDDIGLCLTAAVEGAGVTLGRSLLVADAIAAGRLTAVFGDDGPTMAARRVQVAQWSVELVSDPRVRRFAEWLRGEAEGTLQGCRA
jgi:LysR family glycine cleavage system transcriptional activator